MKYLSLSLAITLLITSPFQSKSQSLTENAISHSAAKQSVSPLNQPIPAPVQVRPYIPGKGRIMAGFGMLFLGGTLQAFGIWLTKKGQDEIEENRRNGDVSKSGGSSDKTFKGAGIFLLGTGVAVPGFILLNKGIRKYRTSTADPAKLTLHIGSNVSLKLKF